MINNLRVVVVLAVLLVVGLIFFSSATPISPRSNREVALACTTDMATKFHIHTRLEISINGEQQEIPADIGDSPTCLNALHTHDATGELHVESPERRDFTLADFFAVWNKAYGKDQILDSKVDGEHVIRETVNGQEVTDYENTVLRDQDQIVISYEKKE